MSETGIITNIQHFSIHDGPGVRTVIFFKGCNLRCKWCHNPETYLQMPQPLFYTERCIGCGVCTTVCKLHTLDDQHIHHMDFSQCKYCLACTKSCYSQALVSVGERVNTDFVMDQIKKQIPYFQQSKGGVTFSGGECMLQLPFLKELLMECKKLGLHTAIDTAGNVPFARFEEILPYTDLFLYDLKAMDEEVHRICTGSSNHVILENFQKLVDRNSEILVRVVYVPGYNDTQLDLIGQFLLSYEENKKITWEILPFHTLGNNKFHALGMSELPLQNVSAKAPEILAAKEMYHFL